MLWNLPAVGDPQPIAAFDGDETVLIDTVDLFVEPDALAVSIESDPDVELPTEPIIAGPTTVDA